MDLSQKQEELDCVRRKLSVSAAIKRTAMWASGVAIIAAVATDNHSARGVAFFTSIGSILFAIIYSKYHTKPLEMRAFRLGVLVKRRTEAPTKIEGRTPEDAVVSPTEWQDYMSRYDQAYWLPDETASLQPGDTVLRHCRKGCGSTGGFTRHKIERYGRIVAQYTYTDSDPFPATRAENRPPSASQPPPATTNLTDLEAQLRALKRLKDDGILTEQEFNAKKQSILGI